MTTKPASGAKKVRVKRLEALADSVAGIDFPVTSPFDSSKPLSFFHKFGQDFRIYRRSHIEPPRELFWIGTFPDALKARLTVGFGGTLSPAVGGVMAASVLAQVVADEDGVTVSGGALGIDTAALLSERSTATVRASLSSQVPYSAALKTGCKTKTHITRIVALLNAVSWRPAD